MYPTTNTVVIPKFGDQPRPITIEEVRQYGRVVTLSEDGTRAAVEVKIPDSYVISYCGVTLNEDGTVKDFIPRVNGYAKYAAVKEKPSE